MSSPDPFWDAMARLHSWKDVAIGWRKHFGPAYGQAEPYFVLEGDTAFHYPCTAPCKEFCRMRVREGKTGFFAFCHDEYPQADPVDLEDKDVLVYRLDIDAIFREIGKALAIAPHSRPEPVTRNAWEIGTVTLPPGRGIPVVLALPLNTRDYTDVAKTLLVRGRSVNVLLVPGACDGETRKLLEDRDGRVFILSDIAPGVPGRTCGIRTLSSVLTAALGPLQPRYRFEKISDCWYIRWDGGETKPIKDSLGLRYYRILIDNPYVTYSAHDLRILADRVPDAPKPGMAIEVADDEALRAYHREMEDLQFQLEEAVKNQDGGASDLRTRIEELKGHIRKTYNLHRWVREESSELERARKSVSIAMDTAREKLSSHGLGDLATYLDKFMPTGTFLKYHPTHRIDWNT